MLGPPRPDVNPEGKGPVMLMVKAAIQVDYITAVEEQQRRFVPVGGPHLY